MANVRYAGKEQRHRIAYTALSQQQVQRALDAVSAPVSVSPLSGALAGTSLKIVTDEGPTLDYAFSSASQLSLSENGGAQAAAGYGALELDDVVIFSHLIAGTQRGFNVIIDRATNLATVFEIWFSGEVVIGVDDARQVLDINREAQRQIWHGYVDTGGAAPEARHEPTNRGEGKAVHWTRDTGERTLEYYSTVFYANIVDFAFDGGEIGFCAPADYIKINDDLYIFSRTWCEFSGELTLYVMNVNTSKQAGVQIGFDAADAFHYRMFTGSGEWVGQVARFEPFGDTRAGTVMPPPADGSPLPKGARRVYRPARTWPVMTKAEVDAAVARSTRVFEPSAMAGNRTPPTDYLAGKSMTLRWDNGSAVEYQFQDASTLRWRREGSSGWRTETYEASESMPHVILFGHLLGGSADHDCQIVAADFEHGMATLVHGAIGTPWYGQEARAETLFGVIEMEGLTAPLYRRHKFTDELVGRAITWSYSPGLTSMHLYSTPNTASWIIFGADGSAGMSWAGPSQQVKIRDGIYLTYWLEEACNGVLGVILLNMRTMHDCGIGYNAGENGLSLGPVGAHARYAGRFDVAHLFEPWS